ncbi:hypothetical protein TSUD_05380 [Trifolium subterraneum]|uniref:Uncharacterized protein n=1 Tax=Trifolium subterraneum TaxID=3900 RepID=A0A2Z6MQ58_TRISU|nr:hypothetical protein TSUD_05380 [Trifolium subterraneum]
MKSFWIVLVMTMVLLSCEFCFVQSRVLRTEVQNAGTTEESVGMTTFYISSNDSNMHDSARSLAYRLTSGPSKRGRGH